MHDLPARSARAAAAATCALCACIDDLARERLVRDQERLRQVEQRRPQLVLDLACCAFACSMYCAVSVRAQLGCVPASSANTASSCGGVRRASRSAMRARARRGARRGSASGSLVGKRREPALGGLRVRERILRGLAEAEHRCRVAAASDRKIARKMRERIAPAASRAPASAGRSSRKRHAATSAGRPAWHASA